MVEAGWKKASRHTYTGVDACKASWQEPHPETVNCPKCGRPAEIFMAVQEGCTRPRGRNFKFACELHENKPGGEGYWFHDAIAAALYCCRHCFEVFVGNWNQA